MSHTLIVPDSFLRRARKFLRAHPDLTERVGDVVRALEADPFQPHLRLHALQGRLAGYYAVSVTYAYRITLTLAITEREITLIDIGTHDDVYR